SVIPDKTLTVKNTGGKALDWSASLGSTTSFHLTGTTEGSIPPGESATITLSSLGVAETATAGQAAEATLTITTTDKKVDVMIRATPSGGTLSLNPTTVAAGQYPLNAQAPDVPVELKNTGNKPVTIALAQPGDAQFGLTWTGAPGTVML